MNTSLKNLLVGIFIISAITILVAFVMFLKPKVGDGKQTLYVRFSDIGSINVGTRVLFSGRPVGEVVELEEIKDARKQPTDELGRVYFYQLTLHVDSGVKVYNTDEISIQRSGLMGERSISITPKTAAQGVTSKLVSDKPIYANSVDSIENALLDFSDLSATMEETFRSMDNWIKNYGDTVGDTVNSAGSTLKELGKTISTVNKVKLVDDIQKSVQSLEEALFSIQTAVNKMEKQSTFQNIGVITQNLKKASHIFESTCKEVSKGKGTVGRLLYDDDLYIKLNSVMSKANNLMNDVNHYGVLFHLNKQWQRTHLKKIVQLNALNTPQNFQNYFQHEVDEINASMTRISMLIENATNNPNEKIILSNPSFKKDFIDLMRKANELSDNLKLYNQQLDQASGYINE